jgi:hypothetical protein
MAVIPKISKGGLDLNSSIATIAPTDYIDAVDITDKSMFNGNERNIKQLNNNADYAFDIGEIVEQPKIYRFSIDFNIGGDPANPTLSYPINTDLYFGLELAGAYSEEWFILDGTSGGQTLATWKTDLENAMTTTFASTLLPAWTFISSLSTTSKLVYDLSLGYFGTSDWNLIILTKQDGDFVQGLFEIVVEPYQDAFSAEKAGALIPIKYANKGDELFVWGTTGTEEEVTYTSEYSIQDVGGNFLGAIDVIAGLDDGDEVLVYFIDSTDTGLSAYYTLQYVTPIIGPPFYALVGSMNPITLYTPNPRGGASVTIVKYNRTASTIGIATKNNVAKEWEYIRLLESNKLNFRTYKQPTDAIVSSYDTGTIFDWTDNLNPIRRLLYKGDWVTNGFLTWYNSQAIYGLDTIEQESRLQIGQNLSKITLTALKEGGTKPEATYMGFVRFGSIEDGSQSLYSKGSNISWVHSLDLGEHAYGNATTMALSFFIEQIPINQYNTAQVGVVEFSEDSFKAYTLPEVQIEGLSEVTIVDIGDVSKYGTFDVTTDVELSLQVFEHAKNLLDFDNRVVTADVKLSTQEDLTEWARTIDLTVTKKNITRNGTDTANSATSDWITNGFNNTEYMTSAALSAMLTETHRICIYVDFVNGAVGVPFFIDDVYFDPAILGYAVSNATSPVVVYQLCIEADNIDMNYLLPSGKLVKDVVKDFRFGRAPIEKEVLATGMGIMLAGTGSAPYKLTNAYYGGTTGTLQTSYLAMYSPDLINNGQTIKRETGDQVIVIPIGLQALYSPVGYTNFVAADYYGNNAGTPLTSAITNLEDLYAGQIGQIANLNKANGIYDIINEGCIAIQLTTAITSAVSGMCFHVIYRRPIANKYSSQPNTYRYTVVPQDKWYDPITHNASTVYTIFSGDCFPQKQYYAIAIDNTPAPTSRLNNMIGLYSWNRTNGELRSGLFPQLTVLQYLLTEAFVGYTYDPTFTPRNQFQSAFAFNPNLLITEETIATIYYSEKRLNGALYGNNRIWKYNFNGVLENLYGRIMGFFNLLGTSGNNALLTIQERGTTLQYFNNSSKLISTSVDILLGVGDVLETKGTFLSVSGCSHKFSMVKCLSPVSNKELLIWFNASDATFSRFGADGSRIISDDISSFLLKNTTLSKQDKYNKVDRPAHDYGVLAAWDNQKKEYVVTFNCVAENRNYNAGIANSVGEVLNGGTTFGFENIPILYKCIQANTGQPLSNTAYFTKYEAYIDDLHQCFTLVWNELDNKWKGFYTYLPKLYGNVMNNYVSGHPTISNLTYEHNQDNNARYFCSVKELGGSNGFFITNNTNYIQVASDGNADDIASWFGISTFPTIPNLDNHTSYFLYIPSQNIYVRITEFIDAYNVKLDINEPIDFGSGVLNEETLYYSICNTGQPYIENVFNEGYPRYFSFGDVQMNIDLPLPRIETIGGLDSMGQKTTQSYMEYADFEYAQGQARVASGMDTTNGSTNKRGFQGIEGYWMRLKSFFQPNIKNKMLDQKIIVVEQNKKIK